MKRMKTKLLLLFASVLLFTGAVFAKTHTIRLHLPTQVGGEELKPGSYRLEIADGKAVFFDGRQRVEAPVSLKESDQKFSKDSARYIDADGKMKVREIRFGGTTTRVVFSETSPNKSAQ
jgi:hypothetical protein